VAKPRVLIAEDHSIVAEGLRAVLESTVDVVDTVADGRALLKAVAAHEPDIVITDLSMPNLNGIDAARKIAKEYPQVRVIVLTRHTDVKFAEAAFRAGVRGYAVKQSNSAELIAAIKEVQSGNFYLSPTVTQDVLGFFIDRVPLSRRADMLTGRQREVLQLIAEGATIKRIADALSISPKTAETHRYAIMKELDLHTTAELTRFAIQHGLISLE
jgi:DNA-binding NarL/FixJ family response regulator